MTVMIHFIDEGRHDLQNKEDLHTGVVLAIEALMLKLV